MGDKFLLQKIIKDIVDTDKSLAKPLMELLYFAKRIKNKELEELVDNEFNGYSDEKAVPSYRKTKGILFVDIMLITSQRLPRIEIPISLLPNEYKSFLNDFPIIQGIKRIEQFIIDSNNNNNNDNNEFAVQLPDEYLRILNDPAKKINRFSKYVISARIVFNPNILTEIISSVRTKLLKFVMDIAEQFGYEIEIETFNKKPENNKIIIEQMNNIINNTGDGNTINMGNNNHNENNISIYKGNIERLQQELSKLGLEQEDINEISEIVKSEPLDEEKGLGERAKKWLHKIFGKVIDGTGDISKGVTVELLTKLITECHI